MVSARWESPQTANYANGACWNNLFINGYTDMWRRFFAAPADYKSLNSWLKWLLLAAILGIPIGLASGGFLMTLQWVTDFRKANTNQILWGLPLAGLFIGYGYHRYGKQVVKGNNLLFEETYAPQKRIPFRMAPMVYLGTILTHLFGGSAGREGTAVQMGGAIADLVYPLIKPDHETRRLLITGGIAAGFSGVFGTPLAGALFAVEAVSSSDRRIKRLFPALLFAFAANWACHQTAAVHVDYRISNALNWQWILAGGIVAISLASGMAAMGFARLTHFFSKIFNHFIGNPIWRPAIGGLLLAVIFYTTPTRPYMGLGIPTIISSFETVQLPWVFALKVIFTAFTLGAGFKGGEVTPLFFTGATLGSAMSGFIPVETTLLTAMGFVAVFGAATKTPIASAIMGMELFGWHFAPLLFPVCLMAYLFSGPTSIYTSQKPGKPGLHHFYIKW
jgi:H+/Cl- antiporter ClcA